MFTSLLDASKLEEKKNSEYERVCSYMGKHKCYS